MCRVNEFFPQNVCLFRSNFELSTSLEALCRLKPPQPRRVQRDARRRKKAFSHSGAVLVMSRKHSVLMQLAIVFQISAAPHDSEDDLREDLGHYVIARQQYGNRASSSRGGDDIRPQRTLSTTNYQPIRIEVRTGSVSALSASDQSFVLSHLIPATISWVGHALQVKPVSGKLRAARFCSSRFLSSGVCAAEGSLPTCGVSASGAALELGTDLLASLEVCSTCYSSGTCYGCSSSPAGAGADADFVLIVSSVATSACAGSTLAYAGTCQRDQYDRPIFGHINFCPSRVDATAVSWESQLSVAIHEAIHALGFSRGSWPLFRNDDSSPRTVRGADGLPPFVTTSCGKCAPRQGRTRFSRHSPPPPIRIR